MRRVRRLQISKLCLATPSSYLSGSSRECRTTAEPRKWKSSRCGRARSNPSTSWSTAAPAIQTCSHQSIEPSSPGIYLFFPTNTGPPFEDNVCTLTQRFNESLDVINPFGEEPADDGLDAGGGAVFESASETTAGTHAAEALERIAGTELDDDPVGVEPVDDGLDAGGGAVFESASETTAGSDAAEAFESIAGTEPDDDRADTDQAQLLIFAASVVAAIGAGLIALRARRNR